MSAPHVPVMIAGKWRWSSDIRSVDESPDQVRALMRLMADVEEAKGANARMLDQQRRFGTQERQ